MKFIDAHVIQKMIMNASFELDPLIIPIANEFVVTMIALCLTPNNEYPISGFPRALVVLEDDPKRAWYSELR